MERVPPHNLEAEQSVLGAVFLDPPSLNTVMDMLVPEDFYAGGHQVIFAAMRDLFQKGQPVDVISVADHLARSGRLEQAGGAAAISLLPDRVATAANLAYWAQLVRQKSILRRVINEATRLIATAYEEPEDIESFLDETETKILDISMAQVTTTYQPISSIVKHSFAQLEEWAEKKALITGVPSGYAELDKYTHGFQKGELVILAGRPSMGKTALALNMARHAAVDYGKTVVMFSMEMSREALVMRLLSSEARIEAERMRGGFISKEEWSKLAITVDSLRAVPIFVDDSSSLSVLEMKAKCRRIQAESGLDLVIIDYLQLIKGSGARRGRDSRENEISEISRNLKAFAKELRIPVIALSQLNRAVEQREDKRPRLSDMRESGAIEQDADVVLFVHRPSLYKSRKNEQGEETNPNADPGKDVDSADENLALVNIGKQRNGPANVDVRFTFKKEFTLFLLYEGRYDESYAPQAPTPF